MTTAGASGRLGCFGDTQSRMRAEISESAAVVARLIADDPGALAAVREEIDRRKPSSVVVVGRGSSHYAGLYGRYLVETLLGLPVVMAAPSVASVFGGGPRFEGALVVAVSQGGRSPDVIATARAARASATLTVSIVNDTTSPLAELADLVVPLGAGPEAVTATKSYVAELAALAAIVTAWAARPDLAGALARVPASIDSAVSETEAWLASEADLVAAFAAADRAQVVSRGYDLATALETAMKLTETCGLLAVGYSAADFAHGHVVASGPDVPLLAFRPEGPAGASVDSAVELANGRGARSWLIGGRAVAGRQGALSLDHGLPGELAPIVHVIAGQMLAEVVARALGRDPDTPVGLRKLILTT